MYNLLLSLGASTAVLLVVWAWLGPMPAIVPAVALLPLLLFLLARRTASLVQKELEGLPVLLQARKLDEAVALLRGIQARHARWQFLLAGQIDAQIGMLDYVQLKFDEARPRLESGRFRNWAAQTCLAAIHWRQGRKPEAWKELESASSSGADEAILYCVWATLLVRDGQRPKALEVLDRGLKRMPKNSMLKDLQSRVANDRKIDTKEFGESWYQFFPEDLRKEMLIRGRKTPSPAAAQQPRFGARHAPRR